MKLIDKLDYDHITLSKETPRTLDEILDSPELAIMIAMGKQENNN